MTQHHGDRITRALSHVEKIFCQPLRGPMLPLVQVERCQPEQSGDKLRGLADPALTE